MNTTPSPAREAVELPELPYLSAFHPIWRAVINWSDAEDGPDAGAAADVFDAAVKEYVKAYARPLLAAKQEEVDKMREALELVNTQVPEDFDAESDGAVLIALGNGDVKRIRAALSPTQGETS